MRSNLGHLILAAMLLPVSFHAAPAELRETINFNREGKFRLGDVPGADADRMKLNQHHVFVNYASWQTDQAAFRKHLIDLAHACNRHHIGLMITDGDSASFIGEDIAPSAVCTM